MTTDDDWVRIPRSEHEELLEIKAATEGHFPRCVIVKPERDRDLYVGWSEGAEAPAWVGTRHEALTEGVPPSRLRRADETGTSSKPEGGAFYRWDAAGMIAEQRGWLPRERLAAYAIAYTEGHLEDCWDLLEPFEDGRPVRRD